MLAYRGLRYSITLAIIAILLIAMLPMVQLSTRAQSFSATLSPIAGLVQYLPRGEAEWQNVVERTLISEGDQIRTGNDGLARLNVVTGISVDVYPTTIITLSRLALGTDDNSALTYTLYQYVGRTYVRVDEELNPQDRVRVVYPTVGLTITATQARFFNLIHPRLDAFVAVEEGEVVGRSIGKPPVTLTPENALYIEFDVPEPAPQVCTTELLEDNVTNVTIVQIEPTGDGIDALRKHLVESVTADVNPEIREFMRGLLELPEVDLPSLDEDEDRIDLEDLLSEVPAFDGNGEELTEFLAAYLSYWRSYFEIRSAAPLAPETCGDGIQDADETPDNCATDFADPDDCGNDRCETDRGIQGDLGESVINCEPDCLPYGPLAASCLIPITTGTEPTESPVPPGSGVGR